MTVDTWRVQGMLAHYAEMLRQEALDHRARGAVSEATGLEWGAEAVDAQIEAITGERDKTLRAKFTGEWVPVEPLGLFAMWRSLLDDIDGQGMAEYLNGDPREGSPLLKCWEETNAVLHLLDPTDRDSARAILSAARRDEEEAGGSWDWDDALLEVAAAHAGEDWQP